MMKRILVIVGPTAVRKSLLSIELAKQLGGEIISGDAMQFYRGLDIGTAKLSEAERQGVPHHLIDILPPEAAFSVADYQAVVRREIAALQARDVTPIIVGGSGLYLQSILYDYRFPGEKRDDHVTEYYDLLASGELMMRLSISDPDLAKTIDINNRRRLLRALEIVETSESIPASTRKQPFYPDFLIIGLQMERSLLIDQIELRVDKMIQNGLIEEARRLFDAGIRGQSTMAIGYKELFRYFMKEISLSDAIELIKTNSRRYAKRQMTWFRNQMDPIWFHVDPHDFQKTIAEVTKFLTKK